MPSSGIKLNSETILFQRQVPLHDLYTNAKKKINENIVLTTAHKKMELSLQDNACPKYSVNCECKNTSQQNTEVLKEVTGGACQCCESIMQDTN